MAGSKRPKVSLLRYTFLSECIGRQQDVNILLPYGCYSDAVPAERPYKTLWLLHGMSDDRETWLRNSVIETLARENDLAVVMPDAANSFYTDMAYGPRYYTYITEELPRVLRGLLPLSDKKEDNFLSGFSMGGYGAFKIGLTKPDCFAAVGCLSSAVDVARLAEDAFSLDPDSAQGRDKQAIFLSVFGSEARNLSQSSHDIRVIIDQCNAEKKQPPVFMSCGTEDFLYADNVSFVKYVQEKGYDVTWTDGPGAHDWNVWNRDIVKFIEFLKSKSLL